MEVEYIPAVIPPEPEASVPHDDWYAMSTRMLVSFSPVSAQAYVLQSL